MSIATSLDKLSETLTNCKANLKEKGVEADSIKISDVDEKIMEIQAGGSGTEPDNTQFTLNSVTFSNEDITSKNNQKIDYGYQKSGDLVFDYNYEGDNYEANLLLAKYDPSTGSSLIYNDIKKGNNQATFNNVSSSPDSGTRYVAIFIKKVGYNLTSKIIFDVHLYNDSDDF